MRDAQASTDEAEQRFLESFVPESVVTGRGPTPEQRKALMNKAGLVGARLRLERARYEQDRATIRSPVNGTVDAIEISAGEKVSAGQALLTVVDTRNLRIEAQVLEHDLPLVRVGGEASISSAGAPGRLLRGRVDALLPLVDSVTRAGRAIVRVQGDGIDWVAKIFAAQTGWRLFPILPDEEARALLLLRGHAIAPEFVEYHPRVGELPAVLIYEFVEGREWTTDTAQVAELFRRQHALVADGFREVPTGSTG